MPARVVALALIAVVIGGLAYVRWASRPDSLSVPDGAKAGDLRLEPCTYPTEDGAYEADCGTLVVPENRAKRTSRLIALPVTRIRARSSRPAAPIFRLDGGPGISNMEFKKASRLAGRRDVVLVGYRGVDGSSVLDCPEVASALKRSSDFLGEKSFRAYAGGFRSCADRLTRDGVDLAGYGLAQQVDDMEAARRALGYGQIDLLSESAGTRTAMIYSWRHPQSIQRSVMIGVNPPGHFLWDAKVTDGQLRRYGAYCAKDDDCRARTDDLAATLRRTAADLPDRWGPLPIKKANVRIAGFLGLFETTQAAGPIAAPMTVDSWLSAAEGHAGGLWFASVLGDLVVPELFTWGEFAAVGVQDAYAADASFAAGGGRDSILGNPMTAFLWGGGRLGRAWPANPDDAEYREVRTSPVETLLIGGELDFSTPPQLATEELLAHLPNGHQVVVPGIGHTESFYNQQPEAGTRLITTFLDTGRVDESLYQPARVDFTPKLRQTTLAKAIAGTMVGLAGLTVISLALMARRVRRRGRFGPKASAALRSLYPFVLGLGGWFLGLLVVMMTMPSMALDNQALAVLFAGTPIGLAVYWAWVHRDWSATTKRSGLAAAAAGALVGAWLGFHATIGLFALITAIAGAIAGANLVLITVDLWRPGTVPAMEPAPSARQSPPPLAASTP